MFDFDDILISECQVLRPHAIQIINELNQVENLKVAFYSKKYNNDLKMKYMFSNV